MGPVKRVQKYFPMGFEVPGNYTKLLVSNGFREKDAKTIGFHRVLMGLGSMQNYWYPMGSVKGGCKNNWFPLGFEVPGSRAKLLVPRVFRGKCSSWGSRGSSK